MAKILVTGGAGPARLASRAWYTYVPLSAKDFKFYIGLTNDLRKRLKEHGEGKVIATKNRRPLRLIYCEIGLSKKDAIKREKYFKMGYGRRFLTHRLENFFREARVAGELKSSTDPTS